MSNNTKAISFWNFLKESTIEIPIIQRDYAQGRLGKENLRKTFLADLKKALDNEHPYKDTPMKLDFVYGSAENGKLNPLDGQQRLTTLWLLHWYIALRAGELSEDGCKIFRKFTYETRISSREFCQNLCVPEYFKDFDGKDIVGFITKQTWFYSAWKQDPTIQSMLRMLGGTKISDKKGEDIFDGIEEIFQETNEDGFKSYWEKLTQKEVIVFYHLPLKDFGLSDDLYIKMNARGKQLTSFENFKADLIGYITNQAEDESLEEPVRAEWKKLLDPESGIPIMLDTEWTDIFWKNKSNDNRIDEIYFAFINRYFLQELTCAKKEDETDLYSANDLEKKSDTFKYLYGNESDDSQLQYSGLEKYLFIVGKPIPLSFFKSIRDSFDKYKSMIECCLNDYFPLWSDSKFEFIPQYDETGNITTLGQKERVVFLAICRYFEKNSFDETYFKQWMRVVWNIVENSGIETISAMIGAMRLIDELSEGANDIYKLLSKKKVKSNFAKDQVTEEIAKAKQILDKQDPRKYDGSLMNKDGSKCETWEDAIKVAEETAFFKGAIRFLFQNEKGEIDLDESTNSWNTTHFDIKWKNSQKYFDDDGVTKKYREKALLLRSLISRIDIEDKIWFGNGKNFWRDVVLYKYQSVVDMLLKQEPKVEQNAENWIKSDNLLAELLGESNNTWHVFSDWRKYKVLTRYSRHESGSVNSWKEVVPLNHPRNVLLNSNEIVVCESNCINGCKDYYYGWNINFKYNKHFFQWWGNPNYDEGVLDVYFMENDDYKSRRHKTKALGDEDTHFCFRVTAETTPESFTKMLDKLIAQVEEDEQSKS